MCFVIPKYKETFILFTIYDKEEFDFDNINEDDVRLAYIFKDNSNGGYAYLKPIDDKQVLRDASNYARDFLYGGYEMTMRARRASSAFKILLGYEEEEE